VKEKREAEPKLDPERGDALLRRALSMPPKREPKEKPQKPALKRKRKAT
jgi:hypothetical protein